MKETRNLQLESRWVSSEHRVRHWKCNQRQAMYDWIIILSYLFTFAWTFSKTVVTEFHSGGNFSGTGFMRWIAEAKHCIHEHWESRMLVIYHKPQNSYIINTDFTLIQSHQPRTFKQCLPKVGLQFQFMFSIFYRCKPKGLSYELISVELALNNTLNPEGYVSTLTHH